MRYLVTAYQFTRYYIQDRVNLQKQTIIQVNKFIFYHTAAFGCNTMCCDRCVLTDCLHLCGDAASTSCAWQMLKTSKYCLYYESYCCLLFRWDNKFDGFQIAVWIKCVEYKKHKKLRTKAAKYHLILALYFLKITYLNWSPWHAVYSCNLERILAITEQRSTTCPRLCGSSL